MAQLPRWSFGLRPNPTAIILRAKRSFASRRMVTVRNFVCAIHGASFETRLRAPQDDGGLGVRKLRESAAKLLKSFVGVNLCAAGFCGSTP